MISKVMIISLLLMVILINLAQTKFTDVPPPPARPERFRSKDELRKYLQKLHEYYIITGRWRLRRNSENDPAQNVSINDLFRFFDINDDHHISPHEFAQRLKFTQLK